jgi:hypothetical protein
VAEALDELFELFELQPRQVGLHPGHCTDPRSQGFRV